MNAPRPERIAVAIVNYNSAGLVEAGLPALMDELARFHAGRIVIVDNASPQGDGERLEAFLAAFPHGGAIRLLRSPVNGGFAAGNNRAFEALAAEDWRPDHVLLLNPDARVTPGAIVALAEAMVRDPAIGVAGAALQEADGTPSGSAFMFPRVLGEFAQSLGIGAALRFWPILAPVGEGPCPVEWVTGAAMMARWRMIEAIGGMDEGYFLYYEEVDYQLSATRAGWRVWHVPGAAVRHDAGGSTGIVDGRARSGRMPGYWFDSWIRYFTKNHGQIHTRLAAAARILGILLARLIGRLRGRSVEGPPHYVRDFAARCLLGPLPDLRT